MLTVADLFAGIGGFHLAFDRAGAKVVFASEINKQARKTYEENYKKSSPNLFNLDLFNEDITKVDLSLVPEITIVAGGFPCQAFSHAGKRDGFDDARGTLFFNVADMIRVKRPAAFFLENVRGLITHDKGDTFRTIQNIIRGLGYSFHYKIIKGSDFNIPQHRPRVFMVGFREDIDDSSFKFPEPVELTNTLSKVLNGKVTNPGGKEKTVGFTLRVGGRHSGVMDRRNWDSYIVNGTPREITLEEAKALMGFPKNFKFPVSDPQAFKQLGNAVVVPAIQATAHNLVKTLAANGIR